MVRLFSRRGRGLLPELLVIEFSVAILDDPHSRRHPETMMFAAGAGVRGVERFFANVGSLRSCNPYAAFAAAHESGPGTNSPVATSGTAKVLRYLTSFPDLSLAYGFPQCLFPSTRPRLDEGLRTCEGKSQPLAT